MKSQLSKEKSGIPSGWKKGKNDKSESESMTLAFVEDYRKGGQKKVKTESKPPISSSQSSEV